MMRDIPSISLQLLFLPGINDMPGVAVRAQNPYINGYNVDSMLKIAKFRRFACTFMP